MIDKKTASEVDHLIGQTVGDSTNLIYRIYKGQQIYYFLNHY